MVDIIALPSLPGLPDLNLLSGVVATAPITADTLDVLSALGPAPWGIYSGGAPVVIADTVAEVGYSKSSGVSNYPIEDGGFSAYDKQATPYEARLRLVSGGSAAARQVLLDSAEAIEDDLGLYDIVSPDRVYTNANLTRFEYRRLAQEGGASLLAVEIGVQEIRTLSVQATGQSTVDPASAAQVDGGTVQPQATTSAQAASTLPFFASGVALPPTLGGRGF